MPQYDIIVIGGGPAGLTAAVYALRAEKKVLVIEKETFGGQITFSPKVENIPGFAEISGMEFADKLTEQALGQGAEFEMCKALSVEDSADGKIVHTDIGDFTAGAVIIAVGSTHRMLGIEKEEDYIGNGISFCAVCDGAFYKDKTVAVIGGGNSALQEALLLSDQAAKLYVVQNLPYLTGESSMASQLSSKSNVEIITSAVVDSIIENGKFEGISIRNTDSGEKRDLILDGMFIAIGLVPQNKPFEDLILLDDYGYAVSDESCRTKVDGVFVAGDCRKKNIRQVATAACDGAVAALAACDWLSK